MKKVFIQSVYPAPYRVDVFEEISKEFDTFVVFENSCGDSRNKDFFKYNNNLNGIILDNQNSKDIYKKEIKKLQSYDIVLFYDYSSFISIKLIVKCILKKIPYLINCDGTVEIKKSVKGIIKRFLIKNSAGLLANGKSAEKYFLAYGADKNKIFKHNFSSLHKSDIIKQIPSEKEKKKLKSDLGLDYDRVFFSVGSFIYRKGYDLLLNALLKVNNDRIGFVIIGGGEEKENYLKFIEDNNLKNIQFLDFMNKEELKKYYDASDVFIFPTREDIWGLVINEAMSRGLPIVSSNKCVAAVELVDRKNGDIFKSNAVDELAIILNKYFKMSSEKLCKMGHESLKKIQNYTIEDVGKSHIEVIYKVINK